jgi:hypothetical protein
MWHGRISFNLLENNVKIYILYPTPKLFGSKAGRIADTDVDMFFAPGRVGVAE